MSRGVLQGLRGLARLTLQEAGSAAGGCQASSAQGSSSGTQTLLRLAHTETGARYSPNQYSRVRPLDRSATWLQKNPYIEALVYRRDKLEREFTWSFRNTLELGYYIGGLTVGFYALAVFTIRQADAANGYPKRDMLFAPSKTGFYLPDERDW
jgi:hypothetical protein